MKVCVWGGLLSARSAETLTMTHTHTQYSFIHISQSNTQSTRWHTCSSLHLDVTYVRTTVQKIEHFVCDFWALMTGSTFFINIFPPINTHKYTHRWNVCLIQWNKMWNYSFVFQVRHSFASFKKIFRFNLIITLAKCMLMNVNMRQYDCK